MLTPKNCPSESPPLTPPMMPAVESSASVSRAPAVT